MGYLRPGKVIRDADGEPIFDIFGAVCPFDEEVEWEDDPETLITGGELGE